MGLSPVCGNIIGLSPGLTVVVVVVVVAVVVGICGNTKGFKFCGAGKFIVGKGTIQKYGLYGYVIIGFENTVINCINQK